MSDDETDDEGDDPLKIELRLSSDGEWFVADAEGLRSTVAYSLVNEEGIGRVTLDLRPPTVQPPG